MDWLEQLKKSKLFRAVAWIAGTVIALGAVAGAINSLIELFNRGWLDGAGGWYATATSWLSTEITIPAWFGLLNAALLLVFLFNVVTYLLRELKPAPTGDELTEEQQNVLAVVGVINHVHDHKPTLKEISEACELTAAVAERAVDALVKKGMIRQTLHFVPRRAFEDPQSVIVSAITRQGRDYLLDAGFDPSNPRHLDEQEA